MARIKGVDVPNNKRSEIALTYIYGIGRSLSNKILTDAKVDVNKKAGDLTNDELARIRDEVNKYTTEGDLRLYLFVDKEQIEMQELVREKVKLLLIRKNRP